MTLKDYEKLYYNITYNIRNNYRKYNIYNSPVHNIYFLYNWAPNSLVNIPY